MQRRIAKTIGANGAGQMTLTELRQHVTSNYEPSDAKLWCERCDVCNQLTQLRPNGCKLRRQRVIKPSIDAVADQVRWLS